MVLVKGRQKKLSMKKIVTLLFLFIGLISMAQSNLTVFNNNGQQFYVILNGIKQNSVPQTNVYISGIRNGSYALKLIFADGKTGDIDKMFFIDTPSDITTRVVFKKGKGKLQWIGQVPTTGVMQQQDVITYRPDNSAVYSDAPVTTTQQVVTQTTTTSNPVVTNSNGTGNGNVTINSGSNGGVEQTGNNSGNVTINSGVNGGTTTTQSGTTGGNITINPSSNGGAQQTGMNGGNVNVNTSTTTTGTTQTTTVTDPSNPNGNFGMNININVTDPTMNNGNGGINIGMNGTGMPTTTQTTTQGGNVTSTTMQSGNLNGVQTTSSSSSTTTTQTTTTTTTSGGTTTYNNGSGVVTTGSTQLNSGMNTGNTIYTNTATTTSNAITCTKVLSDADAYVEELKVITFDEDRKETILKDMMNKCLNASQAYKIIETLTFEEDRLEIAKYLYDRLLDKDKGNSLLPLFKFDSSKTELKEYMKK